MAIPKKVLRHLEKKKVRYERVAHKTVYTAYDLAQTLREKLASVAKTLAVKVDNDHVLVILPGDRRLDLSKLKKMLKAKKAELTSERVMAKVFKVKPGEVTPFGTLHKNAPVLIDKALVGAKKVFASAGSFEESLHLSVKELLKATEAKIGRFSEKAKLKLQVNIKKTKVRRKTLKKRRSGIKK